jgi:hypothetical protein
MRADLIMNKPIYSSFLSCDKDVEKILRTLFVTSKPYSDVLKKLLLINSKDCLQNNENYKKVIDRYSLGDLIEKGYVRLNPKIARGTFEEMKSYIIISLDNFTPNRRNPEYVDYNINFDVVCYMDAWVLDDFKVRPLMICGYIDGILKSLTENNKKIIRSQAAPIKLTGIGSYELLGCNEVVLNEDISMYTLSFRGMHFSEDIQQIGSV